jgi:hypothetical protein
VRKNCLTALILSPNRIFSPHCGQLEKQKCPFYSDWKRGDSEDIAVDGKVWCVEFFGGAKK